MIEAMVKGVFYAILFLIIAWLIDSLWGVFWVKAERTPHEISRVLTPSDDVELVERGEPDMVERAVGGLSPADPPRYIVLREGNSYQTAGVEYTVSEQVTYVRGDIVDDLMIDNSRMALLLSRIDELVKKEMNTKKGEMNEQGGDKVQPEIR